MFNILNTTANLRKYSPLVCKFLDLMPLFSTESNGAAKAPPISLRKWSLEIANFHPLAFELPFLFASRL